MTFEEWACAAGVAIFEHTESFVNELERYPEEIMRDWLDGVDPSETRVTRRLSQEERLLREIAVLRRNLATKNDRIDQLECSETHHRKELQQLGNLHFELRSALVAISGLSSDSTLSELLRGLYYSGRCVLENTPLRMVLHCPTCERSHVDKGEWDTKPHRTHFCEHCGVTWKPFDFPTVGIDRGEEKRKR